MRNLIAVRWENEMGVVVHSVGWEMSRADGTLTLAAKLERVALDGDVPSLIQEIPINNIHTEDWIIGRVV